MQTKHLIVTLFLLLAMMSMSTPAMAAQGDLGREVLPPNDGWAAFGAGTTGGSAAVDSQVYVVTNRAELIAALNNGIFSSTSPSNPSNEPKIIYVDGTIDMNVDDNNQPLTCEDYYRDGYTLEAFLAAYDPAVWGYEEEPSGPLEDARDASHDAQEERVRIRIGSNTTIVGLDKQATIRGGWFDIRGTGRTNIIIRNLTFEDTYDCFTEWDPTDGELGSWNAQYDSIAVRNATHVWIDHNTFVDRETADSKMPHYFGVLYQVHDGQLDITNAADLVTVSWNRFENHDKVMLIGSSDSGTTAANDRGKLRVTLHHNLFEDTGQRTPRVRFGQVHVYNNYYKIGNAENYVYSWGVGLESAIYAENNFFRVNPSTGITPDQFITVFRGTAIHESGTLLNAASQSGHHAIDVLAAYNAVNDPDLLSDVGWTPTLFVDLMETQDVPAAVESGAGPFNW